MLAAPHHPALSSSHKAVLPAAGSCVQVTEQAAFIWFAACCSSLPPVLQAAMTQHPNLSSSAVSQSCLRSLRHEARTLRGAA